MSEPVTDEIIITAHRQENAYEFISSFPVGLSTYCESKGIELSGANDSELPSLE